MLQLRGGNNHGWLLRRLTSSPQCRTFHPGSNWRNEALSRAVVVENQDVTLMDQLLKVVSKSPL